MDTTFSADIRAGLTAPGKFLNSKYFYDNTGSRIFQEIMEMPTYYLTNCEMAIFQQQATAIFDACQFQRKFNLIELGAGDGAKTKELIHSLVTRNVPFTYTPIDISQEANDLLSEKMKAEFPNLDIQPKTGDYFDELKNLRSNDDPSLILFIGSNIGNYEPESADQLFKLLHDAMKPGDQLLIGVDLKKNPIVVRNAYDDPYGITKRFNLNLLTRINRELNGNFDLNQFDFYATYLPETGEVKSYIVSLIDQEVEITSLDLTIPFKKGETIWTELSKKYDLDELKIMIESKGFTHKQHFTDADHYFTDSLFERTV